MTDQNNFNRQVIEEFRGSGAKGMWRKDPGSYLPLEVPRAVYLARHL